MNKLFIIGNGFDLSLGLKTKYEDFLHKLCFDTLNEAINSNIKESKDTEIGYLHTGNTVRIHGFAENSFMSITILSKYAFKPADLKERFKDLKPFIDEFRKSDQIKIKIKNSILKETFLNLTENWVDIERVYFELLKNQLKSLLITLENSKAQDKKSLCINIKSSIQQLNTELKEISDALKEYLSGDVPTNNLDKQVKKHFDLFKSPINDSKGLVHQADNIHLLNFNYTNTLSNYCQNEKFQINHIHGTLDEDIIFGYGDEMDKAYKEMEELNENSFFKYIKSFGYFRNDRYRQLLGFMASGYFQVNIYGHSCGLSDRVLLNEIFEHDKCDSIRVYHIGEQDYINKTMEISRHFTSNKLLRNRILPYNPEDEIPQANSKKQTEYAI